ncbi:MAG: TfoX/Sxy family protein [Brevibacterium sp.]
MPPLQQSLAERIRDELAPDHTVREVTMFGGLSFMVNDKMIVSAGKDGSLLVRVAADDHETLLSEPGARQSVMGKDRTMGPGWITVAAESLDTVSALEFWLDVALRYNRDVTQGR